MSGIEKLTARKLARCLKPGKYGDGGGLYLQVTKRLVKSWIFRYTRNGREHGMGLGPLHAVNLAQARAAARAARAQLIQGIDPLQARASGIVCDNPSPSFDACAAAYIANHREGWKSEKHRKQWETSLQTYASPHFGALDVRLVDTPLVLQALSPIWTSKTETAMRVRERIARVLSWAATSGYRVGENPARWHEHLEELLPKPDRFKRIQHHPAMSYREIGAFLRALASGSGSSAGARALAFTILTACRSGETLQAQWSEIGFDQRLWTIPGERMKNRRAHRVPLSGATLEILQAQAGRDPVWVFPGSRAGKPLSGSVMRNVLRKMGRTDVTVHGFRSTFRVWAAERGTPKEIAELSLAHATGSVIEIAYQRSDLIEQRRALMQDWADWCAVPVDSHSGVDRTTN